MPEEEEKKGPAPSGDAKKKLISENEEESKGESGPVTISVPILNKDPV